MGTVLVIGEHNLFPESKKFIQANLAALAKCGFKTLLHEDAINISNSHLFKRKKSDSKNVLESMQSLRQEALDHNLKMLAIGTKETLEIIKRNQIHPARIAPARQVIFVNQIKSQLNTHEKLIVLLSAGHILPVIHDLLRDQHQILAFSFEPGGQKNLYSSIRGLDDKETFFIINPEHSNICNNLRHIIAHHKLNNMAHKMKADKQNSFINERVNLISLLKMATSFNNFDDKNYQQALATLEYIIGSLFDRASNLEEAIDYTRLSLQRKITHDLPNQEKTESKIKNLENKKQLSDKNFLDQFRSMARPGG